MMLRVAIIVAVLFRGLTALASDVASEPEQASWTEFLRIDEHASTKVFLDYRKGTLIFSPKGSARSGRDVAVLQPNAGPALGIGLKLGPYLSAAFSRTIGQWQPAQASRGRSKITHLEFHWARGAFGLDLSYQDYRGFFLQHLRSADLNILGDSLLSRTKAERLYPEMRQRSAALGAYYVLFPESFAIDTYMNQARRPMASGWSPLVMIVHSQVSFANPEPVFAADEQEILDDDGLTGGRIRSTGLLPGLGGALVDGGYFVSATGCWGYSWQELELTGTSRQGRDRPAATGNLRGSLGYAGPEIFYGLTAYKTVLSSETSSYTLTSTTSLVEIYGGFRF